MLRLFLLSCLASLAVASAGLARTWHVNPDGTGDAPSIQAAIDSVAVGDDIELANGVYSGVGNYNMAIVGKLVYIHSTTGDPHACTIDCERLGNGFIVTSPPQSGKLTLEGVTIRNGRGSPRYEGGAVSSLRVVTATDCIFDGDSTAVYLVTTDGYFTNCVFVNNSDGAVYLNGAGGYFTGCTFLDNYSNRYGGSGGVYAFYDSGAEFTNCTFCGNDIGPEGGGSAICFTRSQVIVRNCTFYGNLGDWGTITADCYWDEDEDHELVLENTIIAYNTGCSLICPYAGPGGTICGLFTRSVKCCDIYGNMMWGQSCDWPSCIAGFKNTNGNFSECPSFCAADLGDLHLCDGSPCLPGNHPTGYNCGLIGAWGQGCACGPSKTEPTTWGAIKAMFK